LLSSVVRLILSYLPPPIVLHIKPSRWALLVRCVFLLLILCALLDFLLIDLTGSFRAMLAWIALLGVSFTLGLQIWGARLWFKTPVVQIVRVFWQTLQQPSLENTLPKKVDPKLAVKANRQTQQQIHACFWQLQDGSLNGHKDNAIYRVSRVRYYWQVLCIYLYAENGNEETFWIWPDMIDRDELHSLWQYMGLVREY
jgi:hypothetical protein